MRWRYCRLVRVAWGHYPLVAAARHGQGSSRCDQGAGRRPGEPSSSGEALSSRLLAVADVITWVGDVGAVVLPRSGSVWPAV